MYKRTKIEAEVHPRFLCLEEFMNYTGLGRGSAMKLGKEIGCVMKVGISLPHWLEKLTGFSSVGFNVGYWSAPMVPYLAQGAVIPPNKEFMAVLGDQKSGNNIEAPESLIRRIVREESGNGKGSTYNVTAQVNRRTLFDLVLEEGKVRRTVTGRNPFETV